MPVQRSAEHQLVLLLGIELDFALSRHFERKVGDRPSRIQHFALVRRLADGEFVLDRRGATREANEDRMSSRKCLSVPFSAITMRSVGTWSKIIVRALGSD